MAESPIIVIGGSSVLRGLDSEYQNECSEWQARCQAVHARFKKKTSCDTRHEIVYEYTNWYEEQPGGNMKSVGKTEPDYKKYYPPEPKRGHCFSFREYDGDVLLERKDYIASQAVFKRCLAFPIETCLNLNHLLYRNPLSVSLSVREDMRISGGSPGETGQKIRTANRNFDLPGECQVKGGGDCASCAREECPCWNNSCYSCAYVDECPIGDDEI